jgi:hypothetical protein
VANPTPESSNQPTPKENIKQMSKFSNLKLRYKIGVGVATGATILGISGGAFAYFTAPQATGSGNASVGGTGTWTVAQTGSSGTIYPGSGSSTITYTVTNSGANADQGFNSVVTTVNADGSGNVFDHNASDAAVPGCKAIWFTPSDTSHAAYNTAVAAGAHETGTATVSMPTANTNQSLCEGVAPDVTITVS